ATALYRSVKKDRIFLTLTFIEHVSDRTGVKILNKFLTVIRKENPGFAYLRIAEHQPNRSTKTIHFHVLMNKKLTIRRYNALWVLQQYNSGLRGYTKTGRKVEIKEIRARYKHDMTASFKTKDPDSIQAVFNPVDTIPAYSITGLATYLTKYMSKPE